MPQIAPIKWTTQQLAEDVAAAIHIFRYERLDEPKGAYDQFYATFEKLFEELIDQMPNIFHDPVDADLLSKLVKGRDRKKAFRYITAPPISEDDLKTLANTQYGPLVLKRDPAAAARVRDTIRAVLDEHRFPWIASGRDPTDEEKGKAIAASAALAATRDVETSRRNYSKQVQEKAVKDLLKALGMKEVPRREIPSLSSAAAPAPGEYCGESLVAGTRADVVARLKNGDIMLIECKVSNSSVNSYKRVVHDTGGKASTWYSS
ncbi:MAG TPA: XamI family restriction endonuclease [Methylovirgula sp.]|nr:XamI family restriction endonuclease [Methylovirgula sp.]